MHSHSLDNDSSSDIFNAIVISRMTYACSSWFGLCSKMQINRLNKILQHAKHLNYCRDDISSIESIVRQRDLAVFDKVLSNSSHLLHALLPPVKSNAHYTHSAIHGYSLPELHPPHDCRNYLIRMLYDKVPK